MINTKVRFEIFKRDLFTCQYCGRSSPEVELQVDHIVPQAKGGSDDVDNLITACSECNYAKNDTHLSDFSYLKNSFEEQVKSLKDIQKRREQFNLFIAYRKELAELEKAEVLEIYLLSSEVIIESDNHYFIKIRNLIKKYGFINVYNAMEKCVSLFYKIDTNCRHFEIEFLPAMCSVLYDEEGLTCKETNSLEAYIIIKMVNDYLLCGYLKEVYNANTDMLLKLLEIFKKKYYPVSKKDTCFLSIFLDIRNICSDTRFSKELRYKNICEYLETGVYDEPQPY